MAYRNDYQALRVKLMELERENERLKQTLKQTNDRLKRLSEKQREEQRRQARRSCIFCGGRLLPVAIFAGHDIRAPLPLNMSTLRFTSPTGGFTHCAAVHSMACSECGMIQNFVGRKDHMPPEMRAELRDEASSTKEGEVTFLGREEHQ